MRVLARFLSSLLSLDSTPITSKVQVRNCDRFVGGIEATRLWQIGSREGVHQGPQRSARMRQSRGQSTCLPRTQMVVTYNVTSLCSYDPLIVFFSFRLGLDEPAVGNMDNAPTPYLPLTSNLCDKMDIETIRPFRVNRTIVHLKCTMSRQKWVVRHPRRRDIWVQIQSWKWDRISLTTEAPWSLKENHWLMKNVAISSKTWKEVRLLPEGKALSSRWKLTFVCGEFSLLILINQICICLFIRIVNSAYEQMIHIFSASSKCSINHKKNAGVGSSSAG